MFNFSMVNSSMCSPSAWDSLNILANQQMWDVKANSIMYMTPTINSGFMPFPDMIGSFPDPIATAQRDLQAMQNGNFNLGGFGMGSMGSGMSMQMPSMQFPPLQFPTLPSSNGTSGANDTKYSKMRNLLIKYRDTYKDKLSDETLKEINDALKQSGTEEEKLDALKAVAKKLDASKLTETLLNSEYKNDLIEVGTISKKDNSSLYKTIGIIDTELKAGNWETLSSTFGAKNGEKDIVKLISAWNDSHKNTNDRGIIRLCADHIGTKTAAKKVQRDIINCLGTSLVAQAAELSSKIDSDCVNLNAAKDEVTKALAGLGTNQDDENAKKFTKQNLLKVADAFDKLYATIRLMQAQSIDEKMNTKYGFLNDVTGKKIVDNTITQKTKDDLKNEGIDVASIKVDKLGTGDGKGSPEEAVNTTPAAGNSAQKTETVTDNTAGAAAGNKKEDPTDEAVKNPVDKNSHLMGKKFYDCIRGYTGEDDFKKMKSYIKQVNSENVEDFLKGYFDECSGWVANGFFEQIAAENESSRLTNGEVVKVMKAIVTRYKDEDLDEDKLDALQTVQDALDTYEEKKPNERFSNEEWFKRLFGCDMLDKLDDAVKTLIYSDKKES